MVGSFDLRGCIAILYSFDGWIENKGRQGRESSIRAVEQGVWVGG